MDTLIQNKHVSHNKVRKLFSIEDRQYLAVGFLEEGESATDGNTALVRIATKRRGAIGDEDTQYISERTSQLPTSLQPYDLVTNKRLPEDPRYVSGFYFASGRWAQEWSSLFGLWRAYVLVVRRLR